MRIIHSFIIHCSQGTAVKYPWEMRASKARKLQDSALRWERKKICSWLSSALLSHTRCCGRPCSFSGKSFAVHPTILTLLTCAHTLWSVKVTLDFGYEFSTGD